MFLAVEGKMSQGREQQNNLWLKFYLLKRLWLSITKKLQKTKRKKKNQFLKNVLLNGTILTRDFSIIKEDGKCSVVTFSEMCLLDCEMLPTRKKHTV